MLCDPAGNMFQVAVQRKQNELYFVDGWIGVGKFYGILLGGWVRLIFVRSDRFIIQVRNRLDQEIHYPSPPRVSWIGDVPKTIDSGTIDNVFSHLAMLSPKTDFFHVLEKILTTNDVVSGYLVSCLCAVIVFLLSSYAFVFFLVGSGPGVLSVCFPSQWRGHRSH